MLPESAVEVGRAANVEFALLEAKEVCVHVIAFNTTTSRTRGRSERGNLRIGAEYKMRLLELFSGTGSVGRVFEQAGWEVVSVDINPKFNPTICCSVIEIPLDKWPPGYFDYIHASPPCCEYSIAHTGSTRDMEAGDMLAIYALQLIELLQPRWFTLENPQSGQLKSRPFMQGLPYADVAYCMYGFPYRKRTRIWNNVPGLTLLNHSCVG